MDPTSWNLDYKTGVGGFIGFTIGVILFVNSPSFEDFIVQTLGISVLLAIYGFALENFSTKYSSAGIILLGGTLIIVLAGGSCGGELTIDNKVSLKPAENPLTGKTYTNGYQGIGGNCKGSYPWYFEKLNSSETQEFCENNPGVKYCKNLE